VGQKTHPTGFRTGINKSHNATWFASYGAYSDVLKEDYEIRTFVEKKLKSVYIEAGKLFYVESGKSVYSKAGIAKLEIRRKINQIELIIHAARPKEIFAKGYQTNLIVEIRNNLKTLVNGSKKIRIKVLRITRSENESSLIARAIADQLEKRVAFRKAIRWATRNLQKNGVKGFKIQVAGRLNGAEIARAEWAREGRVPLQTLRADINYATHRANTR
jgi:small subunit ribosomal protein S3